MVKLSSNPDGQEVHMRTKSLQRLIGHWQIDVQEKSFRRFVALIHCASIPAIIDWVFDKKHLLEKGFFYFEP